MSECDDKANGAHNEWVRDTEKEEWLEELDNNFVATINILERFRGDKERYHVEVDDFIVSVLREIGLEKTSEEYSKAMKYFWYA